MKKSNLFESILFILAGFIFLSVVLLADTILDSLFIGFAAGCFSSGIVMACKYFYWSMPKHRERYHEKIANEKIELHDELKTKLRDKSGRYAYVTGLLAVSVSMVIFSILGQLGIINSSRLIVLYLGGYLLFQIVIGIVIFNQLLKKYE